MAEPQMDIFREGSRHHHLLEYALTPGTDASALAAAVKQARAAAAESPCALVVAFSKSTLELLAPGEVPAAMHDFTPLHGSHHEAPATQNDVWFWLHGAERDDIFDLARAVNAAMSGVGSATLDISGFMYHDARDVTGFVDGSANPKDDARLEAALVPEGETGAGGAYVLGQKWIHDLQAFHALSEADQEKVLGRTKPDSIEMEGDDLPPDSHVGRTDLKVGGVAQKMYRRSVPFGSATEAGLYFLGFCCDIERFDNVLKSMFGLGDDGIHDRLTDFSQAHTGSYWFAPSASALDRL